MAQIILTEEECIEMFYNALCNGMVVMGDYGIDLDWNEEDYKKAKENWAKDTKNEGCAPCYEDIVIQMLKDGGTLQVIDAEDQYNTTITLKEIIERVPKTPMQHLIDMLSENDDATTADVILQTVFYEEVIFG